MRLTACLLLACITSVSVAISSTDGVVSLVNRRMPHHAWAFSFALKNNTELPHASSQPPNDEYSVSARAGKVRIEATTPIALASGLHRYLTDVAHVDLSWFIGSRLHLAPLPLPSLNRSIQGSSTVPWRYHFNTVTFSYTAAFWNWDDWQLQLDWMALHGINLPLAWVGIEKILVEVFTEIGLSLDDIYDFLSGPAFQSWNRFGNIQDSWGGALSQNWVDSQFELQRKIVRRMVELGMTPVLPAFTGFVPRALPRLYPNASFVNGSQWNNFSPQYTNDTFLEPQDELFAVLQKKVIQKQRQYYGNVTHVFTLDQYNENNPASGELDYLRNVTYNTWRTLKAADPHAVWMLQGWLFFSNSDFWNDERVRAYLEGVEDDQDMLILDLFSETQPQWQRLNGYFGKPWIWCQLHDYGGNMGLYGQVENVTINPVEALGNSSSIVGMGLSPEGQEGNEVMYTLLLDQAWSKKPLDTSLYFTTYAAARYGPSAVPEALDSAWQTLLHSVYNNTNLTTQAVTKSMFELRPNSTGLLNRVGHHPTTITYPLDELVKAWRLFLQAANEAPELWLNEAFTFDIADVSRQVLANAFPQLYLSFLDATSANPVSTAAASQIGERMLALLNTLDRLLAAAHPSFHLSTWENAARSWAPGHRNATSEQTASDLLAYNARDLLTLWGPTGEISDYSSRSWSGLMSSFYAQRWRIWLDEYKRLGANGVDQAALHAKLLRWEEGWVRQGLTGLVGLPEKREEGQLLREVVDNIKDQWADELGL